jgi:hypothetical protein
VLDLFTDDVQIYFPKFGIATGKAAFGEPAGLVGHVRARGGCLRLAAPRRHSRLGPRAGRPVHRRGHAYLGHLPDFVIEAMLNELAAELGAALGQERIYIAFGDRTWILDAEDRATLSERFD